MRNFLIKYLPYSLRISIAYLKRVVCYFFNRRNSQQFFICPICKVNQKNLNTDSYSICYNCGSLPRQRAIYYFLEIHSHLFRNQNDKFLHIAPELSTIKIFKNFYNQFIAIDKFEFGYNYPNFVINMDITDLKFDNKQFDIIICNHVLEHVSDDLKAIKEIYRVLNNKGKAFISVPIDYSRKFTYENPSIVTPEDRKIHFWQEDHVRLYGSDFKLIIEKVGFKVIEYRLLENFSTETINHFGLGSESIFLCEK